MGELPKTAVVTGGSGGIGQAVAKRLSAFGLQVIVTYSNNPEGAEKVCQAINESGGQARSCQLDVSKKEEVEGFFKKELKDQVSLEVLVNNAGVTKDGLLLRMKKSDWERVLDVNLHGVFYCLQEASKIMLRQKRGRIVNISSVVGLTGNPGQANYCSSKGGLNSLTKTAALELASRGITVNAVAPGFIETEMTKELDPQTREVYLQRIPLGRLGRPEDVANAVAWLASEEASYITGQILEVNGGLHT